MAQHKDRRPVVIIAGFWVIALGILSVHFATTMHRDRQIIACIESGNGAVKHADGSVDCVSPEVLEAAKWTH